MVFLANVDVDVGRMCVFFWTSANAGADACGGVFGGIAILNRGLQLGLYKVPIGRCEMGETVCTQLYPAFFAEADTAPDLDPASVGRSFPFITYHMLADQDPFNNYLVVGVGKPWFPLILLQVQEIKGR